MSARVNVRLHDGPHDGAYTQMPMRAAQPYAVGEIVAYVLPQRPAVQALYRIECIVPNPAKCPACGVASASNGSAQFVGYASVQ